jgi:hypothetical protein
VAIDTPPVIDLEKKYKVTFKPDAYGVNRAVYDESKAFKLDETNSNWRNILYLDYISSNKKNE